MAGKQWLAGSIIGVFTTSLISDRIGRKKTIIIDELMFFILLFSLINLVLSLTFVKKKRQEKHRKYSRHRYKQIKIIINRTIIKKLKPIRTQS